MCKHTILIGRKDAVKSILVKRLIRSLSMRYGLPIKDDRENLTIELLLAIMKKIDLRDPVHLCCMAASVIGSELP